MFINEHELYLFDLGEPQLQSLPGFLTKFLFSFFHTLGMEDHPSNKRTWVRRFDIVGDKLAITTETQKLLSKAYDAFGDVLDGIINEVLDGDQSLRFLLLQYVTLQLLSDLFTATPFPRWPSYKTQLKQQIYVPIKEFFSYGK